MQNLSFLKLFGSVPVLTEFLYPCVPLPLQTYNVGMCIGEAYIVKVYKFISASLFQIWYQ